MTFVVWYTQLHVLSGGSLMQRNAPGMMSNLEIDYSIPKDVYLLLIANR